MFHNLCFTEAKSFDLYCRGNTVKSNWHFFSQLHYSNIVTLNIEDNKQCDEDIE
ncbi:hypothetical protein BgiBS90_022949, partial [Biomphalaria glabrata]